MNPSDLSATIPQCANCDAPLDGDFCSRCGQSARGLDRSLPGMMRELAEEVFRWEGRAAQTLRQLVTRPGGVSADYLMGRRARYTPPIRFYLVASAVFFVGYRLTRPVDNRYFGIEPGGGAYLDTLANVFILLLPVLAVLLKVLFARTGRPLLHHFVFTLYTGAATLLWMLVLILGASGLKAWWGHYSGAPGFLPDPYFFWLYLPGLVLFLGYLVVALRRTYGTGWPGAVWRAGALCLGAGVAFFAMMVLPGRLFGL